MKVLFVTSTTPDYMSSVLWDGLQEVVGEENVVDVVGSTYLHKSSADVACAAAITLPKFGWAGRNAIRDMSGTREGRTFQAGEDGFDLMVLNAVFNRDHDWDWVKLLSRLLRLGGKIAYVEGWDSPRHICPPDLTVHGVFRRELSADVSYPYSCKHLSLAAPSRWFSPVGERESDAERPVDLFFAGNPDSCEPGRPVRWQMLSKCFQTRHVHSSTLSTHGVGWDFYMKTLRNAKLALCPPGADGCDSNRLFEAGATGAIPVIIGMPTDRIRDPWFPGTTCFSCSVEQLPEHLDEALGNDQTNRRKALLEYTRKHHTTRARAERVLEVL